MTMTLPNILGQALARYLSKPRTGLASVYTSDPALLARVLRPGDVLLVEGDSRFSTCIKYLTQSNWSHSALYVGDALGPPPAGEEARVLIEADINEGVRAIPLSSYTAFPTRICRPLALREADRRRLVWYAVSRIGHRYDLQNVIDLARYLLPILPVPARMRRRLLAFGSGDPTRAICSTLIAQAFQSIGYPVLPRVERRRRADPSCRERVVEILYIRHHSLYAPRDFDLSPYFEVIKPTLQSGFDYRRLRWTKMVAPPPTTGRRIPEPEPVALAIHRVPLREQQQISREESPLPC
jgi:Permuted papain-like amidase enzyme, YaeF/YiiX, C92 family